MKKNKLDIGLEVDKELGRFLLKFSERYLSECRVLIYCIQTTYYISYHLCSMLFVFNGISSCDRTSVNRVLVPLKEVWHRLVERVDSNLHGSDNGHCFPTRRARIWFLCFICMKANLEKKLRWPSSADAAFVTRGFYFQIR